MSADSEGAPARAWRTEHPTGIAEDPVISVWHEREKPAAPSVEYLRAATTGSPEGTEPFDVPAPSSVAGAFATTLALVELLRASAPEAEPSEAALRAAERADVHLCDTAFRPTRSERIAAAVRAAYAVDGLRSSAPAPATEPSEAEVEAGVTAWKAATTEFAGEWTEARTEWVRGIVRQVLRAALGSSAPAPGGATEPCAGGAP